jgi:hypothetical protein
MARITRLPRAVFEECIPRLICIGWIEALTIENKQLEKIPQEGAVIPQEGASSRARAQGMEGNGMEGNGIPSASRHGGGKKPKSTMKKPQTETTEAGKLHAAFIAYFCDQWRDKRGADGNKYVFDGGRDGKAAKKILAAIQNRDEIKELVNKYLNDDDRYTKSIGWTLWHLAERINAYRAKERDEHDLINEMVLGDNEGRISDEEARKILMGPDPDDEPDPSKNGEAT